jgi:L-lactate utilization protein LutB
MRKERGRFPAFLFSNLIMGEKRMTNEERRLIVETLAEMRELKGEMREFKEHVIGRVEKLEKKEAERSKERIGVLSILISAAALAVAILANFLRHGGK